MIKSTIAPGQTYRSNRPTPLGPARIRITGEPGPASVDAADADTGALCVVLLEDLHATAPTGDARHYGYTREDTPDGQTRPDVYGGDSLHPHVWTWAEDDGNGHMGHTCPCGAFRS